MPNPDFIIEVLRTIDEADLHDYLNFTFEGDEVQFYIQCNDVFFWGCADSEDITPDTLPILKQAIADCRAVSEESLAWATEVFAARVRKIRPQGAAYPKDDPGVSALLDACGPERPIGLGNPFAPGDCRA